MVNDEVCNNAFAINVSAVFPSKHVFRNSSWRPLCHPYPPASFAVLSGCRRELCECGREAAVFNSEACSAWEKACGPGGMGGNKTENIAAMAFGFE